MKYTALIKHVITWVKSSEITGALERFTFLVLIFERTDFGLEKIICVIALCFLQRGNEKLSCLNQMPWLGLHFTQGLQGLSDYIRRPYLSGIKQACLETLCILWFMLEALFTLPYQCFPEVIIVLSSQCKANLLNSSSRGAAVGNISGHL